MNINFAEHGAYIFYSVIAWVMLITYLSYKLAIRKTKSVELVSTIGFFLAFIPPLAIIYLIVLALKKDIV
ncbi:conserved hypothetical protein [Candidatus Nitrotoga sp. M5]|nr:conserved hypothetical protein [Candidatus Nitrotoga sp. M5]